MKSNEYGLTAIKLIFTVIILIAVILAVVFIVGELVESSHVTDIKTDLLYIQAKCKGLHDKKVVDANQALLGEEINNFSENDMINNIVSGEDKWYKLSQNDLEQIGVGYLHAEDGFIVNYETEEVIYAKGVQEKEETYYKLSDMVKEEEQGENQETEQETLNETVNEAMDDIANETQEQPIENENNN